MNQKTEKEAPYLAGVHAKEDFPEILEGSENKYSLDVQLQTDKIREYLIGQIETALKSKNDSIRTISKKGDVPPKVALHNPYFIFATNEFYEVYCLSPDYLGDRVICGLGAKKKSSSVPIEHISLDGLNTIVRWLKEQQFIDTRYPAPIPITDKFWNFIETTLPNYHERYDVYRQSELQLYIDGKESKATGLTLEEAIKERDRILFRMYAEAIDAFTRQTVHKKLPGDEEEIDTHGIISEILDSSNSCEAFMDILAQELDTDEETYTHKGSQILQAYQENDCDGILIALCGWSMKSLVQKYANHIKETPLESDEEEEK